MNKIISSLTLLAVLLFSLNVQSGEINKFQIKRSDASLIDYYIKHNSTTSLTTSSVTSAVTGRSNTILMVVQGSDCNSVIYNTKLDQLNLAWPEADLLLVEKYGITSALTYDKNNQRQDCPASYLKMDDLQQRAADILQVVEQIKTNNRYEHFLMIGGSEGAVVANMVASSTDAIDATVSFNGGGRWFLEDVIHSIRHGKQDSPALNAEIKGFTEMANQIVANKDMQVEISGHGSRWWRSVLQLDQLKQLEKVTSPILIIQSEDDQAVSVSSTDKMINSLIDSGKKNISYKKYAGLDHTFKNTDKESKLNDVVKDMHQWFSTVIKTSVISASK